MPQKRFGRVAQDNRFRSLPIANKRSPIPFLLQSTVSLKLLLNCESLPTALPPNAQLPVGQLPILQPSVQPTEPTDAFVMDVETEKLDATLRIDYLSGARCGDGSKASESQSESYKSFLLVILWEHRWSPDRNFCVMTLRMIGDSFYLAPASTGDLRKDSEIAKLQFEQLAKGRVVKKVAVSMPLKQVLVDTRLPNR